MSTSIRLSDLIQLFQGTPLEEAIQKMWEANPDKEFITKEALKGETAKLHEPRLRNGFFEKYCPEHLSGIDIGCGFCPVNETFRRYDYLLGDGDATHMADISDDKFHTVHASHILEHLSDPVLALENWVRICRPGGHVIAVVPHRDLYEKQMRLPSARNPDHKKLYLPYYSDMFDTLGLVEIVSKSVFASYVSIKEVNIYDDGYEANGNDHPSGNYSIELILQKSS